MKPIAILFAYFITSGLLGGLVAYPLSLVIDADFDRIVSRSVLICAVLILLLFLKTLGRSNFIDTPAEASGESFVQKLGRGWLIGFFMLVPIALIQLAFAYRYFESDLEPFILTLLTTIALALPGAMLISLIEEALFRGVIFHQFRRNQKTALAIILSSIIYAAIHFLEPSHLASSEPRGWLSGINLVFQSVQGFSALPEHLDAFVALFLASVFLCLLRIRSGDIFTGIGIHAGWITLIKSFKELTDRNSEIIHAWWLASEHDRFTGHITSLLVLVAILILFAYRQPDARSSSNGQPYK